MNQGAVWNTIQEFLQIEINAPAMAFGDVLLRLCHRLMSRPPRPEPVAVIGKRPVPPPLQNLHHRLLDESIQHRWRDRRQCHSYRYPPGRASTLGVKSLFPGYPS